MENNNNNNKFKGDIASALLPYLSTWEGADDGSAAQLLRPHMKTQSETLAPVQHDRARAVWLFEG